MCFFVPFKGEKTSGKTTDFPARNPHEKEPLPKNLKKESRSTERAPGFSAFIKIKTPYLTH